MQRVQRKLRLGLLAIGLLLGIPLLGAGPSDAPPTKEVEDGVEVFFRDADISATSEQAQEQYTEETPGDNPRIDRAFPGAPPSIPHTTEDMLPITATENECLTCHHPNEAGQGDIPFPKSHYMAPVMGKGKKQDSMAWVVKDYKKLKDLMGARYNCVMCHTEQATNVETPKSTFVVEKVEAKQ